MVLFTLFLLSVKKLQSALWVLLNTAGKLL
nr:MAG TPA: hypothetical protein [Caudoviricetes sp.]